VSKRTGKTHENLETQVTPPPVVTAPARTRSAGVRQGRGDRSGPIGISGGDFATPSARKRTTTQPRGLPVVGPAAEPASVAVNGTPPPVPVQGAQPESPFNVPATGEVGDAASQLAAEAAAVRALDSGPLTPPPVLDDPGPTPPPITSAPITAPSIEPAQAKAPTPPPVVEAPSGFELAAAPAAVVEEPLALELPAAAIEPPTHAPTPPPETGVVSESDATTSAADSQQAVDPQQFAAQETPWPELGAHAARAVTPLPALDPAPAVASLEPSEGTTSSVLEGTTADVADDLELDEAGETLDALPPEALADPGPSPAADLAPTPPPTPKGPPSPPPIPSGTPRRKTGEVRPPEVPTSQVMASLMPEAAPGAPPLPEALAQRPRRPKRSKPWFEEVFDEDYLRTLPFMSADQTLREVEFIEGSLGLRQGSRVLDIGCGYGRHAIELVQRGLDVTGLDLSLPLLIRAADEAQKRAMSVNFVHADMREMAFEQQFDGAYSMLTSFGYFDEEANLRVAEGIARALKPGARFLLDIVNRDYVVGDLPSRVWWEGNGCVVLEEVDFNFHTSRILTHRSIVFEDGRQVEQEISVRAYSLHEIGRLLRQAGFRVLDISGSLATRGHFFGGTSRSLLILAEKRTDEAQ
jgi:SAM-dependent methyltransferase